VAPGERVTPPGQRRQGGSGAQVGRTLGILGSSPQAHTAFASLQASSSSSNTSTSTWDAAGLIAALQNMQLQGNSPWVVDSDASTHMTSSDGMLTQRLPPSISSITVGNGTSIPVMSRGHSVLPTPTTNFALNNILVAPSIVRNLLSVRQFTRDNNCSFEFDAHGFSIKDLRTERVILRCNCDGDLYTMPASTPGAPPHALLAASSTLWHQRLGHPAPAVLERLNKLHVISCNKVQHSLCHSCQLGKHTRLPFSSSHSITHAPFELVHCDVWTSPINSLSGFSYYLVCLDDYTHYCWVFPLRKKSDVHQHLVELAASAQTQFSLPVKCFQADNGTEFVNTATIKFLAAQGTHLRLSCPYTSPQNGKAERIIRTLNNSIRTMLLHASLPPTYWAEGLLIACYLHNRCPSSSIQHEIPYTRLHNQPPTYSHLRVFGSLCYPNMQATSKHKLAPRSTSCIFLGYPSSHKSYHCLDLSTRRIIISRHVTFDETTFPFAATSDFSSSASLEFLLDDDMVSVPCPTVVAGGTPSSMPVVAPSHSDVEQPPPDVAASHDSPSATPGGCGPVPPPGPGVVPFPRVYVHRSRTTSMSEPAAVPAAPMTSSPPTPPRVTRTMTGAIPRVCYEGLAATTSSSPSPLPTNYRSTLADANWRAAMMDEYQALVDNNTWQLVPRPPGANVVTRKWIFRHKFHVDGSLARHKARWVVRGFS
jgi:transposase InsO family protein